MSNSNSILQCVLISTLLFCETAYAQTPNILNYQGRIAVRGVNFDGNGQFKFALVNDDASTTFWSNDGTSVSGSEPSNHVILPVSKGLFSIRLGDGINNNNKMIPSQVFDNSDLKLRIWFNDGEKGWQRLGEDSPLSSSARAAVADRLKRQTTDIYLGLFYASGGFTDYQTSAKPGTQIFLPWGQSDNSGNNRGLIAARDLPNTVKKVNSIKAKFSLTRADGPARCELALYRRSRSGVTESIGIVTQTIVGSNEVKHLTLNHETDWTQYTYYIEFKTIPPNPWNGLQYATIHEADLNVEQ